MVAFCDWVKKFTNLQMLLRNYFLHYTKNMVEFMSRPDSERSTRDNRRVPLNGSQFPETHPRTRKAPGILARLNNGNLPFLSG